jgi:hypothetical protein
MVTFAVGLLQRARHHSLRAAASDDSTYDTATGVAQGNLLFPQEDLASENLRTQTCLRGPQDYGLQPGHRPHPPIQRHPVQSCTMAARHSANSTPRWDVSSSPTRLRERHDERAVSEYAGEIGSHPHIWPARRSTHGPSHTRVRTRFIQPPFQSKALSFVPFHYAKCHVFHKTQAPGAFAV